VQDSDNVTAAHQPGRKEARWTLQGQWGDNAFCPDHGTIELEVKLTGIMQTQALAPGEEVAQAVRIAPDLAAAAEWILAQG